MDKIFYKIYFIILYIHFRTYILSFRSHEPREFHAHSKLFNQRKHLIIRCQNVWAPSYSSNTVLILCEINEFLNNNLAQ
jgi:hypothetical protein